MPTTIPKTPGQRIIPLPLVREARRLHEHDAEGVRWTVRDIQEWLRVEHNLPMNYQSVRRMLARQTYADVDHEAQDAGQAA